MLGQYGRTELETVSLARARDYGGFKVLAVLSSLGLRVSIDIGLGVIPPAARLCFRGFSTGFVLGNDGAKCPLNSSKSPGALVL